MTYNIINNNNNNSLIMIIIIIINIIFIINDCLVFCDSEEYVGDSCHIRHSGSEGICRSLPDCPVVIRDIRRKIFHHSVCGYIGAIQTVCCPISKTISTTTITPLSTGRNEMPLPNEASSKSTQQSISAQKCSEYKEYIYENVNINLIVNVKPHIVKVRRCALDSLPLIVGGIEARIGEFPHMALLGYNTENGIRWGCGGSLISDQHILTAGHCIRTSQFGQVKWIKLGAHKLPSTVPQPNNNNNNNDDNNYDDYSQDMHIKNIYLHPNYTSSSRYNDIAIIQLKENITFNEYIRPACLPSEIDKKIGIDNSNTVIVGDINNDNDDDDDDNEKNKKMIATGWGYEQSQSNGKMSDTLRKVILEVFTYDECNQTFSINRRLKYGIQNLTQMCAGSHSESKDTCQGDSGGPLQYRHPVYDCMYTLMGITSFGKDCGLINIPGVYTRLEAFVTWIEQIVWPNNN